jgi:hypothetical protein
MALQSHVDRSDPPAGWLRKAGGPWVDSDLFSSADAVLTRSWVASSIFGWVRSAAGTRKESGTAAACRGWTFGGWIVVLVVAWQRRLQIRRGRFRLLVARAEESGHGVVKEAAYA